MKIAWLLIVIGALLFLEGTIRVVNGVMVGYYLLSVGGVLTGWLLGWWLLRKGLHRRKSFLIDAAKA